MAITVEVLGKKNCRLCESVKQKLDMLKQPYTFFDIDSQVLVPHPGWQSDGSVERMAQLARNQMTIPTVVIDGMAYTYSAAMAHLKGAKEQA